MGFAKTEEQKYKVIKSEKEFEIRYYPSATLATVYSSAKSYKELSGSGFRKLAGYIFGDNNTSTRISMTSPVHMDISQSGSSMSFVMPSSYNPDNLPDPVDKDVKIEKSEEGYFAAIRFSGYASDEDIIKYSGRLKDLLNEKGISYYGNFRYLGYDPPFKPFGRRNEIIVAVWWDDNSSH
ncbi:MAG TPA: SOUL heme-binding protein [Bacteroidales bacterium]|nr:SOUL heme-binding protein [Bacteroidales bacterium]